MCSIHVIEPPPFQISSQGHLQGHATAIRRRSPSHLPVSASFEKSRKRTSFHQPSRKRTRFHPAVVVRPIDCRMTPEERSRSYYSEGEMESFSFEVRTIRAVSKACPARCGCAVHSTEHDCASGISAEDRSLCGLEVHLCPTRNRIMTIVRKSLLKFHRKLQLMPDKTKEERSRLLAAASAKLSRWSRRVALGTARSDLLAVCGADDLIPINEALDVTPAMAFCQSVTCDDDDRHPTKRARSC